MKLQWFWRLLTGAFTLSVTTGAIEPPEPELLREAMKLSTSAPSNIRKSLLQEVQLLTYICGRGCQQRAENDGNKDNAEEPALKDKALSHCAARRWSIALSNITTPILEKAANFSILFGILGVIGAEAMRRGGHGHTLRPCRSTTSSCTFCCGCG